MFSCIIIKKIMKKNTFWVLFLILYLARTVHESVSELIVNPLWYSAIFFLGLLVSAFSHHYRTSFNILFIVAHIGIETVEYAIHLEHYLIVSFSILWVLAHIWMDYTFLWKEIGHHYPKYTKTIFISIIGLLISVFITICNMEIDTISKHSHNDPLHILVLGGLTGCLISHILFDVFKKKHTHTQHNQ
jgi:hypothetical protein